MKRRTVGAVADFRRPGMQEGLPAMRGQPFVHLPASRAGGPGGATTLLGALNQSFSRS